jgi:UDPglucose 6-dehydrogenase
MNIGFIGIGKLGLPCAEQISKKGHTVTGFDKCAVISNFIEMKNNIKDVVKNADIVFVAVPTPHDSLYDGSAPTSHLEPKDFNYDIVKSCLLEANTYMNKNQLLVLISTVLPGTIRQYLISFVNNTRFIYNPYLIAMGSVEQDMINPEMVIIGTKDGSETSDAEQLISFYKTIIENDARYVVGTWDEAECIKIFYNTFISAKIGLVNMIQDVAQRQGNIDVDVVTDALAKSTQRIISSKYMTAGMGDGGACHPRDNIALRYLAQKLDLGYDLFDSIMNAREIQAKNLALELVKHADRKKYKIYIHGKAYKPKVSYIDGSYSILVGNYCEKLGHLVTYIDPYTGDNYVPTNPGVFLIAHSSEVTYSQDNELYCEIPPNSVIVDPWRKIKNNSSEVIYYGNTRKQTYL